MNFIIKLLGSGLYTGHIPFASGTFGSAAATLIYFIPGFSDLKITGAAIIISALIGVFIGNKFEEKYGKDPSEFTLDEFTGTWISYLFLPLNVYWIVAAFFLWRLLDIIKPYPAGKVESINGGTGIMADDIVSGIYTCIIMNIIYRFF